MAEIIDPVIHSWNLEIMENLLWRVGIERILTVPAGAPAVEDRIIWHFTNTRMFFSKVLVSSYIFSAAHQFPCAYIAVIKAKAVG